MGSKLFALPRSRISTNGRLMGVHRYLCMDCGKNFSRSTRINYNLKRREGLSVCLHWLFLKHSLRRSARERGISLLTRFNWRNKFLTAVRDFYPEGFGGIVKSDDLFFPFSQKDVRYIGWTYYN